MVELPDTGIFIFGTIIYAVFIVATYMEFRKLGKGAEDR